MPNSFQLIDIVIIIGICQGIFLSLTLHRITNYNRKANWVLSLLLIVATFILIGRFLFFRFLNAAVFEYSLFGDSLIFLFGPLLYMYVKRLLYKENLDFKLPWFHFAPFFALILLATYYSVFYNPAAYYQLYLNGNLTLVFNAIIALGLLSNFYYLLQSALLVRSFKKMEKEAFSFHQSPLQFLYFLLFAIALTLCAWLFGFVNGTFFDTYFKYIGYESVWVAIPVFIYVIGYFSLKQPELFRLPIQKNTKERKERLNERDALILSKKLDSLMTNEKLFLQGNLTLKEVSEVLKTSTNNLSWLLNNVYKTTFYDYINGYRVKEFICKVENKEHLQHTILALSLDVGFNSKSTFNKAFKTVMKDTPSNFIKKHWAA